MMLKDYVGDDEDADQEEREETLVGHCMGDSPDVYIGRHGYNGEKDITNTEIGEPGWLGNPFRLDDHDREESVARFCDLLLERVDDDPKLRRALAEEVAGRTLGCWCRPVDDEEPLCHGDVIARVADALADKSAQLTTEVDPHE